LRHQAAASVTYAPAYIYSFTRSVDYKTRTFEQMTEQTLLDAGKFRV